MALIGLSVAGTDSFQSSLDPAKGTPEATVFTLGTLDVFITAHIIDRAMQFSGQGEDTKIEFRNNQQNIDAVRFGLKGWANFKDAAGNDIPFKTLKRNVHGRDYTVVSDDSLNALPLELIEELAGELRKKNTLTKDEAKNSAVALSAS